MQSVVILNARAGTARKRARRNLEPRIAQLFADVGLEPVIIVVGGKDLTAVAKQAVVGDPKTIVAAGGDGTVSSVAAEVAGTRNVLGVLPLGTLNHFARDLHVPLQLRSAVRTVVDHHVVAIDVGDVNGRVFINNSSLGIYAHIVRRRIAEQDASSFLAQGVSVGLGGVAGFSAISISSSSHRNGRQNANTEDAVLVCGK